MVDDPAHFLNELPIWKLKIVAAEFGIDVSACRYKRDFVEKVRSKKLTEEQVRDVLAKARKEPDQGSGAAEMREVAREVQQIADKPLEATELPTDEEKAVERNLDEALTMRPSFFEVDSSSESAYNRMILGDFYNAIRTNREAREKCLETFSSAQVYSAAVSIRAADELLLRLGSSGRRIDPSLKTALAEAKRTFIAGTPRAREEALESLETLTTKAYEAAVSDSEREEAELRSLLADYESFGTRTEEARRYMDIAAQAKSAFNLSDHSKFLKEARTHAERAKSSRAQEIDNSFHIVRAGTEEARALGVDVSSAEPGFTDARKAFEAGSLKRAADLLAEIERVTDSAHMDLLRRQRDLESVQLGKVRLTISTYEPMLAEAASYGFDVREGTRIVSCAKAALANRDLVNAAKFARRTKELSEPLEKSLDMKRAELGVIKKVEGAKCEGCGHESVYLHPTAQMKCLDCGHVHSAQGAQPQMPTQQPVTAPIPPEPTPPKRRGLFRR